MKQIKKMTVIFLSLIILSTIGFSSVVTYSATSTTDSAVGSNIVNSELKGINKTSFKKVTYSDLTKPLVNLTWIETPGVSYYQIARLKSGERNFRYFKTYNTSYIDTTISAGTTYYYQIRSVYVTANKTLYSSWSGVVSINTLSKPAVRLSNKSNGIRAQWNTVSGAEKYIVFYKDKTAKQWSSIKTEKTFYPLLNTESGKLYYFQILPIGKNNIKGQYSNVSSLTFLGTPVVTVKKANQNMVLNAVDLSWNSISGANKYEIARMRVGDTKFTYSTSTSSYFTDYVTPGKTYIYQVRAIYATKKSGTAYGSYSKGASIQYGYSIEKAVEDDSNYVSRSFKDLYGRELTSNERKTLESLISIEYGNDYSGSIMVAQCLRDALADGQCDRVENAPKYLGYEDGLIEYNTGYVSQYAKDAVRIIFDEGKSGINHRVLFMYNPKIIKSEWHESQHYICSVGDVRFFDRW